jgi:hypothetical protein
MRIALIHAVQVVMQPVEDAFQRHWPQAERVNSATRSQSTARTTRLSRRRLHAASLH